MILLVFTTEGEYLCLQYHEMFHRVQTMPMGANRDKFVLKERHSRAKVNEI